MAKVCKAYFLSSNQRKSGFSIVGVLVAAGLMGLLALVFSSAIVGSKKAQTGVQNSLDFDIMRNSVQQLITKSDICKDIFFSRDGTSRAKLNPASPPGVNRRLYAIKYQGSTVVAKNKHLGGGLKITKLRFHNVVTLAPNSYKAFLQIEAERSTGGLGGKTITNALNMPLLSITTDPANDEIIGCGAASQGTFELLHSFVTPVSGTFISGTIDLDAGKSFDDYRVIHVLGVCTDSYLTTCDTQANSQGPGYFSVPVGLLKSKPGYLFRAQTFSGDDSGTIAFKYISDTSFGWATMRRGRMGEIWGER